MPKKPIIAQQPFPAKLPGFRKRLNDLPILIEHLISKYNKKLKLNIRGVSTELFTLLQNHHWPGNVRELEHFLASGMSSLGGQEQYIELKNVPPGISSKLTASIPWQET